MSIDLPSTFRFGASTAAYQIEGAVAEGGRGRSIWDTFCAEQDRVVDGSSGAEACDHYHRYAEDVALLKGLGVDGYRLSIAWPRIQPDGTGAPNAEGIAFYDRLLDELLGAGIDPMVTLYHWDLPQALEDDGGWLNRATAERFSEYAAICGERFGDRVRQWVPVNEPNVASLMGYALGMHAPGKTLMFDALPACHHLLLAHGLGTQALRGAGVGEIGCANNHAPMWPASDGDGDLAATGLFDDLWNNLFADPMLLGEWPEDLAPLMEPLAREGDLATINQPLDFYGVNYYNPYLVAAAAEGAELPFEYRDIEGCPTTDFGWPVVPDGLREQLVTLHRRYADLPPVVITESGCAYNLGPDEAGVVDDRARIDYLDSHLRAVADAIAEGVDVRGYFTWSIIDNFEWSEGYTQRFGLVHVDYDTQQRTPKKSYDWYRAYIAAAGQDR